MTREESIGLAVLIDDDADENFVNKRLLHKTKLASDVITYENPVAAVAYLERRDRPTIDLLIVDINMPEMSGFEVIERHRALPEERQARRIVMLLTSSLYPADMEKARKYPEIVYRNKPLASDTLIEILKDKGQ